jgi:hypothetical protein
MATFNVPVATVVWDSDTSTVLRITGQYNTNTTVSNTKVLTANTVRGANASKLCIIDVTAVQFAIGTANGFVSLEYISSNGNNTIVSLGKFQTGEIEAYMSNPVGANTTGDINLFTSNLDANDSFSMVISLRKNNFNGAYDNIASVPYS